jgi:nicotinamidase-related amidase
MNLETTVLYVIDVQNGFVTEQSRHAVPQIVDLVSRWSELGGRMVFSRYHNYAGSELERLVDWRQLYGSPETDLVPDLEPYAQHAPVIDKGTYSGLTREMLQLIHRNRWTDVVMCGIDTDLCVLATAIEAFDHGLTPWVVTDASASTGGPSVHEAAIMIMARGIGSQQMVGMIDILDSARNTLRGA